MPTTYNLSLIDSFENIDMVDLHQEGNDSALQLYRLNLYNSIRDMAKNVSIQQSKILKLQKHISQALKEELIRVIDEQIQNNFISQSCLDTDMAIRRELYRTVDKLSAMKAQLKNTGVFL